MLEHATSRHENGKLRDGLRPEHTEHFISLDYILFADDCRYRVAYKSVFEECEVLLNISCSHSTVKNTVTYEDGMLPRGISSSRTV